MLNEIKQKYTKCMLCTALRFLGAFSKLRKATTSFLMSTHPSVRPSVRVEQLCSQWMDSCDLVFEYFSNTSREKKSEVS